MITDPIFYAAAIPAVLVTGISKGGFGGIALLAVPLLALVVSPVQAAGIMLPILVAMDVMTVSVYRRRWDRRILIAMVPGAVVGITIGALTAGIVSDQLIRLIVGLIAVCFALLQWFGFGTEGVSDKSSNAKGVLWGGLAGYTSFIAHAGAPPFQAHVLPLKQDRRLYAGTAMMFFAAINAIKVPPYAFLGMLAPSNLWTSLVLLPVAALGVAIGVWANRTLSNRAFYAVMYPIIFLVGLRLIWDALLGGTH